MQLIHFFIVYFFLSLSSNIKISLVVNPFSHYSNLNVFIYIKIPTNLFPNGSKFSFYACKWSYVFCMLSWINIRVLIQRRWLSITYCDGLKAFLRTLVWILSYRFSHCLYHRMLVWIDSIHYWFLMFFSALFSFFFLLSICSFFFGFLFRRLILHFDKFLIFTVCHSCK